MLPSASPPRLLHVFYSFGSGGTELRMARIWNALGREFQHTVLSLNGDTAAACRLADELKVSVIAGFPGTGWRRVAGLRRLIGQRHPDVVLTYNWGAIDAGIAAALPPAYPWIHHECGLGPDEAARLLRRRVWARRLLLPRCRAVVAVSPNILATVRDVYRVPRRLVRYIPAGVDTERFQPRDRQAARLALGLPPSGVGFGYVGMLRPEKRPDILLEAWAALRPPDSFLVFAGDGPWRERLGRQAAQLGVARRTIFCGLVADTPSLYNALDVFLLSSATEGAPNALLEAMASGLPCVSTRVGGCPALLGEENPGLVPFGAIGEYTACLELLLSDPAARARLGAVNRGRALAHFPESAMLDAYRGLYREASGGGLGDPSPCAA